MSLKNHYFDNDVEITHIDIRKVQHNSNAKLHASEFGTHSEFALKTPCKNFGHTGSGSKIRNSGNHGSNLKQHHSRLGFLLC